ncbi:MAG: hypothetical protein H6825_00360 [Planctomycetes bacterium]|nr:hypothetical protein [Planctomycetota bacterium]
MRSSGRLGSAVGACVLAVVCLLACACGDAQDDSRVARDAQESHDASTPTAHTDPWPVDAVPPSPLLDAKGRCEVCHGSGRPPEWAFASDDIEAITVKRGVGYGFGDPGARADTRLSLDGCERTWDVDNDFTRAMGWLPATMSGHQVAPRDAVVFDAATRAVAATGLFRHDGEAATSDCDPHGEVWAIAIERRGRAPCMVTSMCGPGDDDHPTFLALVDELLRLEARLAWEDAPR